MRKQSWGEYQKSLLDILIEKYRLLQIARYLPHNSNVLDLGCGYKAELLNHFSSRIKHGVGIDISVREGANKNNITLIRGHVDRHIKLKSDSFHAITALAIIEHTENPDKMLQEAHRLLKKNGILLLTTPDKKSKRLLEFMAFRLRVISKNEIGDHKRYYTKGSLLEILIKAGFNKKRINIDTLGLGSILFIRAKK